MITEELKQYLNQISTFYSEGDNWHRKAANECRKFYCTRAWGRWHETESECDHKSQLCLEKLVRDNLKYSPVVDVNYVAKAYNYTIADFEAFKNHHTQWIARENKFIEALNNAIEESRKINMEIYKYLCCCVEEVQNEAMRVEWAFGGMEFTDWATHDLRVVSKWLHDYFEHEYKGGKIDFNIG